MERSAKLMKLDTIQIRYNTEKLCILRHYIDDTALQTELQAQLQTLYEKHVPAEIRAGIDSQEGGTTV
ncbi:DUF6103 family protein [Methylomusa anaerophila]|nr:DUF6103 family protein [Methylomusa anaerophila]